MTDQIAYQEYIQRRYNAFCKTVIRCAALDKILKLKRQWERQVSLDYLMNEKFVQFAASEPDEEYPFTVCGQTVLLCNAALADAISVLPEQTREEILPLLLSAPAAARDRRVYWPVTQHSGAAYPACLAAATRRNGGEPGMSRLLPYETILKAREGDPEAVNAVLLHYAGYIRYFSKVNGQVNAEVEDYVKQRLIDCQFKFRLDEPPDKS